MFDKVFVHHDAVFILPGEYPFRLNIKYPSALLKEEDTDEQQMSLLE